MQVIKKYCRGCGRKLTAIDGAFWKMDNRCLPCRLQRYTSGPVAALPFPAAPVKAPPILRSFFNA